LDLKLIAALVLLSAVASAADLPSDIMGTVVQEFDNGSLCINTTDGLINVILAYPVSLPNREMQFEVLGRDILGRVVMKPIIEGCSACSAGVYEEDSSGRRVEVNYSPGPSTLPDATFEQPDSESSRTSTGGSFDTSCYKAPTTTEFPRVYE
jgi:hypothetical protein